MKMLIITFAAFFSLSAHAEIVCASGAAFTKKLMSCDDNKIAGTHATTCKNILLKRAKEKGEALGKLMTELNKFSSSSQKDKMLTAVARLKESANALQDQIEELRENAALLEAYTSEMIDFEDGVDDETSAECFSSAFHVIQNAVDTIDEELKKATAARNQAIKLVELNETNSANLEESMGSTNKIISGGQASSTKPPTVRAKKKGAGSDITGTKPSKK